MRATMTSFAACPAPVNLWDHVSNRYLWRYPPGKSSPLRPPTALTAALLVATMGGLTDRTDERVRSTPGGLQRTTQRTETTTPSPAQSGPISAAGRKGKCVRKSRHCSQTTTIDAWCRTDHHRARSGRSVAARFRRSRPRPRPQHMSLRRQLTSSGSTSSAEVSGASSCQSSEISSIAS